MPQAKPSHRKIERVAFATAAFAKLPVLGVLDFGCIHVSTTIDIHAATQYSTTDNPVAESKLHDCKSR